MICGSPAVQALRLARYQLFTNTLWIPPLSRLPDIETSQDFGESIPVVYTNDPTSAQEWIETHLASRPVAVGWDMESRQRMPGHPDGYYGPSTVQMSVTDATLVLQIAQEDPGSLAADMIPLLDELLSDPNVLKVGVSIDQDMLELVQWNHHPDRLKDIRSRLEIGWLGSTHPGRSMSLKSIASSHLGVDLAKSKRLALSNWARVPLTDNQLIYAARDAWVSAAVVQELAARDPNAYSVEALLELVGDQEQTLSDLDVRAKALRKARRRVSKILGKGSERRELHVLSDTQRSELEQLRETIKRLAPPFSALDFDTM